MSERAIGVGLIGCGTVGSGVVKLLVEEAELYAERLGRPLALRKVLVREIRSDDPRTRQVPATALTDAPETFFADDSLDVVIELVGGTTFAREVIRRALEAGKHVITANKALLAAHGAELFGLAREHGVAIGFEASCAGGIPLITAMQFNLISNRITALYGILNGTCNYILTQMAEAGKTYDAALTEAQEAGYAEADPTLDVGGGDSAHKLAILGSMAFGADITDDQIPTAGINQIQSIDLTFGHEQGYELKLLAIGERRDGGIYLAVAPCFVARDQPLAQVRGSFNAASIFGHAVGQTMSYGRGAGQMPTAAAVVGDLLNIADGAYGQAFANLRAWADQFDPPALMNPDDLESRFYMRLNALDVPGVVARFSQVLGEEGISIAAVSQHEQRVGSFVPVVVVTHAAKAGAVSRAAARIAALKEIDGEPVCIRIVDMPEG